MYEKLNIKKVIIAISIGVLLIVSIIVFTISRIGAHRNKVKSDSIINVQTIPETTINVYKDIAGTVSIELDKKYNLVQSQNSEYLIKLSSNADVDIYLSKLDGLGERELYSVARADKLSYLESYNSYSNLSDLRELNVNGNQAFTYSFHYLDENLRKAFYIQVVLLKIGEDIYVFDMDFPLDELNFYTNLLTETLAEFKALS